MVKVSEGWVVFHRLLIHVGRLLGLLGYRQESQGTLHRDFHIEVC